MASEAVQVTVTRKALRADLANHATKPDEFTSIALHLGSDDGFLEVAIHDQPERDSGLRLYFSSVNRSISGAELRKIRSFFVNDPRIEALCEDDEL